MMMFTDTWTLSMSGIRRHFLPSQFWQLLSVIRCARAVHRAHWWWNPKIIAHTAVCRHTAYAIETNYFQKCQFFPLSMCFKSMLKLFLYCLLKVVKYSCEITLRRHFLPSQFWQFLSVIRCARAVHRAHWWQNPKIIARTTVYNWD